LRSRSVAGDEITPASLAQQIAAEESDSPASEPEAIESFPRIWNLTPAITFQLRGRIDVDAIWSSQSAKNLATYGDLGDAFGLRRARVGGEGDLGSIGRYVIELDLASGEVIARDLYVGFGDFTDGGERRAGHFREPFSLEGGTSSKYYAFLERSPVYVLDPARNWGLGFFREDDERNTTLQLGVFQSGTDPNDFNGGSGATVDFTGKLTAAPINLDDAERLLHFGIALTGRLPEHGLIIINGQPNESLLSTGDSPTSPFVPTINIPATFEQLINLQTAWARGPLWGQAEWYGALIDQIGGGNVFFHGCHADLGYFVTGEHRAYDGEKGVFGPVTVKHPLMRGRAARDRERGWGACELTARFAYLDFYSPNAPTNSAGEVIGTRLPTATFGANWYLADRLRLMFNYTYEVPNQPGTGNSSASFFATRLAVYW
jgi:phosphate-selective porin OprO/OprP